MLRHCAPPRKLSNLKHQIKCSESIQEKLQELCGVHFQWEYCVKLRDFYPRHQIRIEVTSFLGSDDKSR
jgi:hypothetical protein